MKYTAKTHVAISVPMPNGTNVHISFTPQTGGGSVFYTNNNQLAEAIEKHNKYGKLFKKDAEKPVKVVRTKENASKEAVAEPKEPKKKKLSFACYEDAKDYLVDTVGISRTKLRTKTAIQSAAKANDIDLNIEE